MKVIHFVKVRFDKRAPHIDQQWLDTRFDFFINNTLKSLLAQTNKDWILWINCQEGMRDNVKKLVDWLEEHLGIYVLTFGDGPIKPGLLSSYKYDLQPYHTWEDRLQKSDMVYVTRIDSDDLYSPDALSLARFCLPKEHGKRVEASVFKRGYMYDIRNGKIGVYENHSSPFHTLMIPTELFLDREKYRQFVWSRGGDHSKVYSAFPTQTLPDWKFTVLIHGNNFISDFNYSRNGGYIPAGWSIDNFINPPVVFDVDDFCDRNNCLEELATLKEHYPNFKCTLFTIPAQTSLELLKKAHKTGYIELCPHGIMHMPNEELKTLKPDFLVETYNKLDTRYYTKGFRPPGWWIQPEHCRALSDKGYWIAIHEKDEGRLRASCTKGYYVCGQRYPYSHHHTHNVCNNWIKQDLLQLLINWPKDQKFAYVSEAVLVPSL